MDPFLQAEIKAALKYSRHFATWPSKCNLEWNTNTKIRAAINGYQRSPVTTTHGSGSNSSLHLATKKHGQTSIPCLYQKKAVHNPMLPTRARYATMTTTPHNPDIPKLSHRPPPDQTPQTPHHFTTRITPISHSPQTHPFYAADVSFPIVPLTNFERKRRINPRPGFVM